MFGWLRPTQEPAPAPEVERQGSAFSTHADDGDDPIVPGNPRRAATVWNKFVAHLAASRPVAALAPGQAMDSADGDEGNLKEAFALSQPNVGELLMMWYVSQSFIGHQMCAIVAQHWLIDKACSMPARDAIRTGYTLTSSDGEDLAPDLLEQIKQYDKAFGLDRNLLQFVRLGRIFGVRIVFFKVVSPDPDYYEKPFNIDGVTSKSYKGMVQVDPYWTSPILDQEASASPDSMHFYEPTWWLINGKRYHRSHLIIFRNSEVPDILKPSYLYGGVPVPQQIMERVYAAERTANEGPLLATSKRTTVFSTNLKAAFANKDKFDERMAQWVEYRDNHQIKIADTTADKVEQFDTTLSDLDSVIMTQYQLVAAAARVPATKLLGTTPKGFNSTGEYEESNYHEELESLQTHDLTPLMARHHQLVVKAYTNGAINVTVAWNPLDSPTGLELAQENLAKAQGGAALVTSGAIDGIDERTRIINDKDSGYAGLPEALRPDETNEDDGTQKDPTVPA